MAIRTMGGNGTFDEVVASSSEQVRELAYATRALIADVMPDVVEVPWAHQKTVGYGVGPKKMSEHSCYIAPHGDYVNLGFFYGAELDDPEGLLEGTGALLRHVKIRSAADLESPSLRALVEQASGHLPKLEG
jgi:hypothetical protein